MDECKDRKTEKPFWEKKSLEQMTDTEWELLCDGCGRCCLEKLEYEDTGEVYYTSVACQYLDVWTCRCRDYQGRKKNIPDCLSINPKQIRKIKWLPRTCAYRRIAEGKGLADWHPLKTGDRESVHQAGISVRYKAIPANRVKEEDLEAYIVDGEI